MPKSNLPGEKTVFVVEGQTSEDQDLLCSVEEYVKAHYKGLGYTHGLHAEGSIVNTITAILFWDIIYDHDVPDVFRSPQQAGMYVMHICVALILMNMLFSSIGLQLSGFLRGQKRSN